MSAFDDGSLDAAALSAQMAAVSQNAQAMTGVFVEELGRASTAMRSAGGEARGLSTALGTSLRSAFDRLVFGGAQLSDVLQRLGQDLSSRVLNSAMAPVQSAIGDGVAGLITQGVGGLLGGLNLFADGAAFSSGRVRAFAGGGVVDGPSLFPMRGATGLMGEAGPEAIMPLSRGADGRLGIVAKGSGGAPHVTVNITTPDVEGFRRSRSQVAAQLARAVQFGQRGL